MKTDPNAMQRKIDRKTVWGPVLALVSVNVDAEKKSFTPKGEDEPVSYLDCQKSVKGGFIPLYVFGEDLKKFCGESIPAKIELRTKTVEGQLIHYLRADALSTDAPRPDVKLYVGSGNDPNVTLLEGYPRFEGAFPRLKGGEKITKKFVIGFVPARKAKAA